MRKWRNIANDSSNRSQGSQQKKRHTHTQSEENIQDYSELQREKKRIWTLFKERFFPPVRWWHSHTLFGSSAKDKKKRVLTPLCSVCRWVHVCQYEPKTHVQRIDAFSEREMKRDRDYETDTNFVVASFLFCEEFNLICNFYRMFVCVFVSRSVKTPSSVVRFDVTAVEATSSKSPSLERCTSFHWIES